MSKPTSVPLPVGGVDALSSETALPEGVVRSAVNVDISREGRVSRRAGFTPLDSVPDTHSLFYAAQRGWVLLARSDRLYRFDPATAAVTELAVLRSPDPVSYVEYNGSLYFTNRTTFGWIPTGDVIVRPVGVPVPTAPTLAVSPNGGLTAGKYAVAITLVSDRGEEGGTSEVQIIDLPAGGGIQLSNLPQQMGWQVYAYITPPNGDVLRFAAGFSAVFPTYLVAETPYGGMPDTQFLRPLPAGQIVRWHSGRLFVARGDALYFSEAMRPHLYNPAHGVIPFSGEITFVESVGDGVYVGDARGVWFLDGEDPAKFALRRVSTCRAVAGSSVMVPPEHFDADQVQSKSPVAVWLSTSGYVVGASGGVAAELQSARIRIPSGLAGRSAFLFRNGRRQMVTPVRPT